MATDTTSFKPTPTQPEAPAPATAPAASNSQKPAETASSPASSILLRAPQHLEIDEPTGFTLPTQKWLLGTWYVTHSSLPLWKDKRNVVITYKPLPAPENAKLDDFLSYQTLSSTKFKTVHGIDTPAADGKGIYNWRGLGWLKIASSRWELLGCGDEADGEQWVVTYFAKTLFTPAGLDVYSRKREGLKPETLERVKGALKELMGGGEGTPLRQLTEAMFEVGRDADGEGAPTKP